MSIKISLQLLKVNLQTKDGCGSPELGEPKLYNF